MKVPDKIHIFDQKNNAKIFFTDLPTLFYPGPLQETNNFFFRPYQYLPSFSWTFPAPSKVIWGLAADYSAVSGNITSISRLPEDGETAVTMVTIQVVSGGMAA